jgi:hypothetical protein
MSAEALGFHHDLMLAFGRNGKEIDLAVSENTIYIEKQEFDFAGACCGG